MEAPRLAVRARARITFRLNGETDISERTSENALYHDAVRIFKPDTCCSPSRRGGPSS